MYVGRGNGSRAWAVKTHRSKEHQDYLEELMGKGLLPCDWVSIELRDLEHKEAVKLEKEFIDYFKPRFNKKFGEKLMKMTLEQFEWAKGQREQGRYYRLIAEDIGVSTMTLHRALNGGSVRYEEILNEQPTN